MGISNRERHQYIGFITSETKHHSLVAGALIAIQPFPFINALGDVCRLFVKGGHDCTTGIVKTHLRGGVTDILDGIAHGLSQIHFSVAGDFSSDNNQSGINERLASDA